MRLAQPEMAKRPHLPAELAVFGRRAVILVNPTRTLEERAGVTLVPLSDGRALISFDQSTDIAKLELRLQDAVEDHRLPAEDQRVFETVAEIPQERPPLTRSRAAAEEHHHSRRDPSLRAGLARHGQTVRLPWKENETLKLQNAILVTAVLTLLTVGCGDGNKATAPAPLPDARLTAPQPLSPSDGEQTSTLRPTLTVQKNGTTDQQTGTRTYEFQISDKSDFSSAVTSNISAYAAVVSKSGVAEGTDGKTSFTPEQDLQPTTRYSFRARASA